MYSACRDNLGKLRYMWCARIAYHGCIFLFYFRKNMALQVSPSTWRACMEWVVRGALGGVALKQPPRCINNYF